MAMEKEVIDIEHHFWSFKKIIGDEETFCLLELGLRKQYWQRRRPQTLGNRK